MTSDNLAQHNDMMHKRKEEAISELHKLKEQTPETSPLHAQCSRALDQIKGVFNDMEGIVAQLESEIDVLRKDLESKEKEIEKVIVTDRLTSLYNRSHMISVLEREIARCKRYGHSLALMMIDIDDFRSFNESYGQSAGDEMLSFAGNLIRENIRKFDRAFRYGGEEFIVVMPETDLTMAFIAAERIRKSFQNGTFSVKNKQKNTTYSASRTLSIGITYSFSYHTESIDIETLIEQAEKSIVLAKEKGGNVSLRHDELENSSP